MSDTTRLVIFDDGVVRITEITDASTGAVIGSDATDLTGGDA